MPVSQNDISVLRRLAEQVAEIASLPVQKQTADEWLRLNSLKMGRPLVWINELPWQEMNVNDEMTLLCQDQFCRGVEWNLRATLYLWNHMRGDMVVEPVYYSPLIIHDSGFGIQETGDDIPQFANGGIHSSEYRPQINSEADIAKIKDPVVTHDEEVSERNFQLLSDVFGDTLPVQKCGIVHMWFSPWDTLIRWWGVQEALTDIAMRPELVHMAMDRLTNAYLSWLTQLEDLNLLSLTPGNYRVGSGGLGYSDEIPTAGFDASKVRTIDQWGCATAQIFSSVSPAMHEEFALQYERRWLSRFGINYYGCCEPLHDKLDVLASIPNLRKISMSPWADLDKAVPRMRDRYVVSYKPSPAVFATDSYDATKARRDLEDALRKCEGCVVEIIMKDVSTTRNDPKRVWQWMEMAKEVAENFGR